MPLAKNNNPHHFPVGSICYMEFTAPGIGFQSSPYLPIALPQMGRQEDPLEKGKAPHSSILAWRIAWTLKSMGLPRVGHD